MSKVAMTELSVERCLHDLPYEILFLIFRSLPKGKLAEISKLCLKFRNIAGDTRLWKDVIFRYAKYDTRVRDATTFAFEELYSGPWPVKEIDLEGTRIKPPVSWKTVTDQVVKVTRLDLSMIAADKVTLEAILATYQCTEICFNCNTVDRHGRIEGIAPETFSKQTALEMLSLMFTMRRRHYDSRVLRAPRNMIQLLPNLSNCKNLKTLYFRALFDNLDLPGFAKNLPSSIEKLSIEYLECLEDPFFKLLTESVPNLRELALICPDASVKCPSLLKFKFLEALHIHSCDHHHISDLNMYLIKFPALKTVNIGCILFLNSERSHVELAETLTPQGIIVRSELNPNDWTSECWSSVFKDQREDGNVCEVSKKVVFL